MTKGELSMIFSKPNNEENNLTILLKRANTMTKGEPEDIAEAAAFLASSRARSVRMNKIAKLYKCSARY